MPVWLPHLIIIVFKCIYLNITHYWSASYFEVRLTSPLVLMIYKPLIFYINSLSFNDSEGYCAQCSNTSRRKTSQLCEQKSRLVTVEFCAALEVIKSSQINAYDKHAPIIMGDRCMYSNRWHRTAHACAPLIGRATLRVIPSPYTGNRHEFLIQLTEIVETHSPWILISPEPDISNGYLPRWLLKIWRNKVCVFHALSDPPVGGRRTLSAPAIITCKSWAADGRRQSATSGKCRWEMTLFKTSASIGNR